MKLYRICINSDCAIKLNFHFFFLPFNKFILLWVSRINLCASIIAGLGFANSGLAVNLITQ